MVLEQLDIYVQKMNLDPYTSYMWINLKCFLGLKVKPKIMKLIEENLCDLGLGKYFLDMTLKHSHKRKKW